MRLPIKKMRRPLDIPFERDRYHRLISLIIAFFTFMAIMAVAGALALEHISDRWKDGLQHAASIDIPPLLGIEGAGTNNLSDNRPTRAIAIALSFAGVRDAKLLEPQKIYDLMRPWLGDNIEVERLPLPRLINLTIDAANPPDFAEMRRVLQLEIPNSKIIDFGNWRNKLYKYIQGLSLMAVFVIIVVAAGTSCLIIFVSLAWLASHKPSIELLHIIGAKDNYIASQFQSQAMRLASVGAVMGSFGGLIVILLFGHFGMSREVLPDTIFVLSLQDWLYLLLVPFAIISLTSLGARLTVLHMLGRML